MNKYFYIVFAAEAGSLFEIYKDGKKKYYADIMRVSTKDNIAARLEHIGGLLHANICRTKKDAETIKSAWNETYKLNGDYIFD